MSRTARTELEEADDARLNRFGKVEDTGTQSSHQQLDQIREQARCDRSDGGSRDSAARVGKDDPHCDEDQCRSVRSAEMLGPLETDWSAPLEAMSFEVTGQRMIKNQKRCQTEQQQGRADLTDAQPRSALSRVSGRGDALGLHQ